VCGRDTQYAVAIQHELLPRVSAEFSYHWRTFHGFTVRTTVRSDLTITTQLPSTRPTIRACPAVASNGSSLDANWCAASSIITPALGRPLVAGATGQSVNLTVPGQLYGNRINQVDLRVAKILRLAGTLTMVGFDLYNLFNSNPALTWDQNYGVNYLRPTAILMPRFIRFNATVDF
jgi:hypothetical protein